VIASSIQDKRFRPIIASSRRNWLAKVHPLVVIADLRNGCLSSLERYLAQNRGIFDRGIALELRKLVAGTQYRSRYKLMVVEHPDKPKSKGGRPRRNGTASTAKERALVAEFERQRKIEGKNYRAKEVLVEQGHASGSTIDRARRNIKVADAAKAKRAETRLECETKHAELIERRRLALEKLRRDKA